MLLIEVYGYNLVIKVICIYDFGYFCKVNFNFSKYLLVFLFVKLRM